MPGGASAEASAGLHARRRGRGVTRERGSGRAAGVAGEDASSARDGPAAAGSHGRRHGVDGWPASVIRGSEPVSAGCALRGCVGRRSSSASASLAELARLERGERTRPTGGLLKVRRVEQPAHGRHPIHGQAGLPRMLEDQRFVRSEIDAVDLVVGEETVDPLNFRPSSPRASIDFSEASRISASESLDAPGMCRSITNCGMVPSCPAAPSS